MFGVGIVAGLSGAACTVSNTSKGGAEGLMPEIHPDAPSERSTELFLDPGDNLLAALAEVEVEDADVLAGGNYVLGEMLNEVGDYYSAAVRYQPGGSPFALQSEQCDSSVLPDAVEVLCDNIADPRIQFVFIDETPYFAQHRVLGRRLLQCAREAGFEYLVIEALGEDGAALAARGHVSRTESGPYVREPQFAGLIEEGLSLGFTPVGLPSAELCTDCTPVQAFSQNAEPKADSLIQQTVTVKPDARVLVWAGPGEAYEQPWGPRPFVNSLASYVFSKTGIDPYTITQVTLDPNSALGPVPASGMYLATGPDNGSCSGSYSPESATGKSTNDGVVMHIAPRGDAQGSDNDRWDWLHAPADQRMSVTADCASCVGDQRLLVQAFPSGADVASRVPADQALCLPGVACQLALPAGDYQLVVWSEASQLASTAVTLTPGVVATVSTP
jgi:hypothetical protein